MSAQANTWKRCIHLFRSMGLNGRARTALFEGCFPRVFPKTWANSSRKTISELLPQDAGCVQGSAVPSPLHMCFSANPSSVLSRTLVGPALPRLMFSRALCSEEVSETFFEVTSFEFFCLSLLLSHVLTSIQARFHLYRSSPAEKS